MMDARSTAPPPKASQAPVSMPMQALAKMMGSPPRAKVASVPLLPVPSTQRGLNPDSRLSPQEQSEEQTQQPQEDSLALAVLEQSKALTSLISQLQGADPLLDSTSLMTATRQGEAAEGVGDSFGRLLPCGCPECISSDEASVKGSRFFGGDGSHGLQHGSVLGEIRRLRKCPRARHCAIYALSFVVDSALRGDLEGVRERSSLLAVALEQAAQDQNRWELAFQLLLLEDPPPQIWSYRQGGAPHTGRARCKFYQIHLCRLRASTIRKAIQAMSFLIAKL